MGLIRKVIQAGTSKVVTIPPSWLRFHERQTGKSIEELIMEINSTIRVRSVTEIRGELLHE